MSMVFNCGWFSNSGNQPYHVESQQHKTGHILGTSFKVIILCTLIATLISPIGCGQKPEHRKIDLTNREPMELAATERLSQVRLRIAVAGVLSPTETLRSYDQLVSYLGQVLHQPGKLEQRRTYAEINDLLKSRFVDLAFVCGFPYVEGHEEFGMEILVVPEVDGETVYYSYIIVPVDSDAGELKDLRSKTFAFADPMSNSGRLAPTYRLYQMGETPDSFFRKYIFTYSHHNSIRAVAENLVDGAAVDSLVYDYLVAHEPIIGERTRVVEKSLPFGIPPVVVHPALNLEIKARLRGLFLNMNQDKAGRDILRNLMIDRFILGSDASYDTIRKMASELGW